MKISTHFIISMLVALGLYPILGANSFWMLFGGCLIDFDHYLFSVARFKSLSLKKAYWWHRWHGTTPDYERDILHIFHTAEFFIGMIILSLLWEPAFYILQGMILHILMDYMKQYRDNTTDARTISLIGWLRRREYI